MKIGKINPELFSSVLKNKLGKWSENVIVPPAPGIDAGVIDIGDGKVLIIAEDPVFAIPGQPLEMFGWYSVHIGASDIAVMGVAPQYMTYSLLMPPEFSEEDFKTVVDSIHNTAADLGIAIVGGHTGHYPGFAAPTIGGITVFAITTNDSYITPAGAKPGDAVILTKGPAVETTGILSVLREKDLLKRHPLSLIKKAQEMVKEMSVVRDAQIAMAAGGITAMHDATEGGVIGGLFEIAQASGVGMEIDESLFIYPDETRMVCEFFNLDPVAAIAEGSLLITVKEKHADGLIEKLKENNIPASVIGIVTEDMTKKTIKRRDGRAEPLLMPEQDPFWPVFFESVKNQD